MNCEEVGDILLSDPAAHEIGDKEPAQVAKRINGSWRQLSDQILAEPFKAIEKALHITSSKYPWTGIRFCMSLGGPSDRSSLRTLQVLFKLGGYPSSHHPFC